jgi:hypothetical protein
VRVEVLLSLAYAQAVDIRKTLIVLGIALVAAGLFWPRLRQLGLGSLPGDIAINRPSVQIFFPIATCLVISAVLTLLFWIIRK